jgi:hypothetical protein
MDIIDHDPLLRRKVDARLSLFVVDVLKSSAQDIAQKMLVQSAILTYLLGILVQFERFESTWIKCEIIKSSSKTCW